jgi:hypothetical protein
LILQVKTDLTLGGFGGTFTKAPAKKSMLEQEGVIFHENSKGEWAIDSSYLHEFN